MTQGKRFEAKAYPGEEGWELHVDGVGVTHVRSLLRAEQQVRDFVESVVGSDAGDAQIVLCIGD